MYVKLKGFTLVELLIVIAVIGVLAAVLFPVFAKAREQGKSASCLSNLKQIGLGLVAYTTDFDETEPCGVDRYGRMNGWIEQIYPYIGSDSVFHCPDDPTANAGSSYGINANLGIITSNPMPAQALNIGKLKSPSNTVMLFEVQNDQYFDPSVTGVNTNNADWYKVGGSDAFAKDASGYGIGGDASTNSDPGGQNGGDGLTDTVGQAGVLQYATGRMQNSTGNNFTAETGRHRDGSNFLMCDTHAKFLRGSQVSAGYTLNWDNNDAKNGPFCGQSTPNSVAAETGCTKAAATFSTE